MIDIHHLEVFCKCAESGSFSEAAKALNIKQSTISTHIKTIESEIKVILFDRRKGRIFLTQAGEILYQEGLQVISSRKKAIDAVHNFLGRIEGTIHLGASTIPAAYILPQIISGFSKIHPKVSFSLTAGNTESILDDIRLEKVELGGVGSPPDEGEFTSFILDIDELLLAFSPGYFSEIGEAITLFELKKFPFILREKGSGTRQLMEAVFYKAGFALSEFNIVAEIGSLEAVKQAVLAGIGVSLIPELALEFETRAGILKAIHISDLSFSRNFYLARLISKTLSPVAQAFWDFAENLKNNA